MGFCISKNRKKKKVIGKSKSKFDNNKLKFEISLFPFKEHNCHKF